MFSVVTETTHSFSIFQKKWAKIFDFSKITKNKLIKLFKKVNQNMSTSKFLGCQFFYYPSFSRGIKYNFFQKLIWSSKSFCNLHIEWLPENPVTIEFSRYWNSFFCKNTGFNPLTLVSIKTFFSIEVDAWRNVDFVPCKGILILQ